MKKYILVIITFLIFLSLLSCNIMSPCKDTELKRMKSIDGKVDAVEVSKDCGATTSYSYKVFIVPSEKSVAKTNPVLEADHIDGVSINWVSPKQLEIKYKKARIFHFTNFWQSREVDNFNYTVEIREVQSEK